jgi:hypothetical protein
MYMHPYTASQVARERQRDMLAQADHHRLARQLRQHARASQDARATEHRLRRALRATLRLRPAVGV